MAMEGKVSFVVSEGVFYNPMAEISRDIFSLCIGAVGEKIEMLDAMCASGVRGIRCKKENENVKSLILLDRSKKAIECAKRNAKINRVKCRCIQADVNGFLFKKDDFDFVELDPFGSPLPYLYDSVRSLSKKKKSYLSVTATDMAVLCGANYSACLKNYGAIPLDNEFCHENAIRILIAKVILTAAQFNLSAEPILSLSHRHYVKIMFLLKRSAAGAVKSVKSIGFVSYCPSCCFRETARLPKRERCPHCNHLFVFAGPVYLGGILDSEILEKMLTLNAHRNYTKKKEIEKILTAMLAESRIPSYAYYDLHVLAKKMKKPIISIEEALEKIGKGGFACSRTHFCPTAVRTDAPHREVIKLLFK